MSQTDVIIVLWILGGGATCMSFTEDASKGKQPGWAFTVFLFALWPVVMAGASIAISLYLAVKYMRRLWRGCRAFWRAVREQEAA